GVGPVDRLGELGDGHPVGVDDAVHPHGVAAEPGHETCDEGDVVGLAPVDVAEGPDPLDVIAQTLGHGVPVVGDHAVEKPLHNPAAAVDGRRLPGGHVVVGGCRGGAESASGGDGRNV